jgi:hypothetical protein
MADESNQIDPVGEFGPKLSRLARLSLMVSVFVLLLVVAFVVTRLVATSPMTPLGHLGYGNAGVSGTGGYVAGSPFSVMTPPLVNLGKVPLTLESVALVSTGCRATTVSSALYRFSGAGVEFGPGTEPPSRFGLKIRVGQLLGTVLRPGAELKPGYKDVLTLFVRPPGAVLIAGFKVTYEMGGIRRSQTLIVPQVYLPYGRREVRTAADWNLQKLVLNSLRISKLGIPSPIPCQYIH